MEETITKRTDGDACSSSPNAAPKRTKMTNMLSILDENSLLQVLLRTHSEDHNALRQTCRRFQSIIDSELYRQQRAQQEWAQVETHVLTAEENYREASEFPEDDPDDLEELSTFRDNYCELGYKHHSGAIENEFRVMVDGKVGGSGKFKLIERNNNGRSDFHATCDDISQEVHDTGCLFFDKKGRPRLPSLKEAMDTNNMSDSTGTTSSDGLQKKSYFVYLEKFELNPVHRHNNATYVGAKAIRSLLLDSPLKDKWSVVIYIADAEACFSEQDRKRSLDQRDLYYYGITGSDEEKERILREKKDWEERLRILSKVDLRQFLRCGFQQATDSLQKSACLYAFTVPTILRTHNSMLSHEEAMAATIVDRTDLPFNEEMSTVDSKLLSFMARSCIERRDLCETIKCKQDTPLPTVDKDFQQALSNHAAALASARAELTSHDSKVKAEVAKLVGENNDGGASVKNSNALHACAVYLTPEYIDLLLDFVPDDAERPLVLNKYNKRGITPLMVVALISHSNSNLQPRLEMAEKLIGLGADKNMTDVFGETALGKFRSMMQSMADEGLEHPPQEDLVRMEEVLRPVGGPTAADESYLDDSDDDSDFRWDEED